MNVIFPVTFRMPGEAPGATIPATGAELEMVPIPLIVPVFTNPASKFADPSKVKVPGLLNAVPLAQKILPSGRICIRLLL